MSLRHRKTNVLLSSLLQPYLELKHTKITTAYPRCTHTNVNKLLTSYILIRNYLPLVHSLFTNSNMTNTFVPPFTPNFLRKFFRNFLYTYMYLFHFTLLKYVKLLYIYLYNIYNTYVLYSSKCKVSKLYNFVVILHKYSILEIDFKYNNVYNFFQISFSFFRVVKLYEQSVNRSNTSSQSYARVNTRFAPLHNLVLMCSYICIKFN